MGLAPCLSSPLAVQNTVLQGWFGALRVPVGLLKDPTGQESCVQGCSLSLS